MTTRYSDGGGWEETAGYSRAVRRGKRIAVSGTTTNGDASAATGVQAEAALRSALAGVEALGGTIDDVIRTRMYLAPDADWEEASRAHRLVMGAVSPANTTLYVHHLIGDGYLVEVEIEAEVLE